MNLKGGQIGRNNGTLSTELDTDVYVEDWGSGQVCCTKCSKESENSGNDETDVSEGDTTDETRNQKLRVVKRG